MPNQTVESELFGNGSGHTVPGKLNVATPTFPVDVAKIVTPLYVTELPDCGNNPAVVQDGQIGVDVGVDVGGVFVGVKVAVLVGVFVFVGVFVGVAKGNDKVGVGV